MLEPKDEIKQRLDIVEVISEYLPLKPAGSGGFKACCPFHGEKTPSFHVSREKQIWHCFGCDKGGDLFSFIMELEGLSFPDVLKLTATKAGVKLPEKPMSEAFRSAKKEKDLLLDAHILAQKLYTKILKDHDRAKKARDYLNARGIDNDLIDKFGLGFAPDEWNMLSTFLQKRNFKDEIIINSGLGKKKMSGSGIIDRFRNRILVPLHEPRGKIIGFTGRSLVETDKSGPKYLNSPETKIYNKSSVLYGLHLAKTAIRTEKSVIIVEGNLDVIASHKAGVKNIVASSGTALTEIQLQILKKLTNNLIFCFDSDDAGFKAALRGIRLAQRMEFDVSVVLIPDDMGKDPDDVVQRNPQDWINISKNPIHIMKYYFDRIFSKIEISNVTEKKKAIAFMLSEIAQYQNTVEQEHWLMQLADRTRIDKDVLRKELKKISSPQKSNQVKQEKPIVKVKKSRQDSVVSFLLGIILSDSIQYSDIFESLSDEMIGNKQLKQVYNDAKVAYTSHKSSINAQKSLFSILHQLYRNEDQEENALFISALVLTIEQRMDGFQEKHVREEIDRHINILTQVPRKKRLMDLESDIRQAEMSGDKELARKLTDKYLEALKSK